MDTVVKNNNRLMVLGEMVRQICFEYRSLPDPRTLTEGEIRWFYDGIRPLLKKRTRGDGQ